MQPRCERDAGAFEAALGAERARLVRLCARITGNADAAEDLAQETLVEAWRALSRLRDPGGLSPWLAAGLTSAKSILSRLLADNDARYRRGLARGEAICLDCGRPVPVRLWTPADAPDMGPLTYGITLACDHCRGGDNASLWHLMIDLPAGRRFWRRYPHMRALPIREITFEGWPALLTGFESVDGPARLDVVSARETLDVLRIAGGIEGEATS